MHNDAIKYIRLSDISAYQICPRLAYYRLRHDEHAPSAEIVRSVVFKEISRSLASAMASADPESLLRSQVDVACADAGIVYGLRTDEIRAEAKGCVNDILAGLETEAARVGREKLLAILSPAGRTQAIYSERLRMAGSVDRIVQFGGGRCPVVVCASRPPENGIYAADRLKLAACAMLVEEKYGDTVGRGYVEYVCGWRVREAEVRRHDRMAALSARNRVAQMGTAMPDTRHGAWCRSCAYAESCNVRPTMGSSLFGTLFGSSVGPQ